TDIPSLKSSVSASILQNLFHFDSANIFHKLVPFSFSALHCIPFSCPANKSFFRFDSEHIVFSLFFLLNQHTQGFWLSKSPYRISNIVPLFHPHKNRYCIFIHRMTSTQRNIVDISIKSVMKTRSACKSIKIFFSL